MVVCILFSVVFSLLVLEVFCIICRFFVRVFMFLFRLVKVDVELSVKVEIVSIVNSFLCIVYFFFII